MPSARAAWVAARGAAHSLKMPFVPRGVGSAFKTRSISSADIPRSIIFRFSAVAERSCSIRYQPVIAMNTIGIAHPGQVPIVVGAVAGRVPLSQVALDFHDTRGTALANVLAALDLGVATFDASAGGLGGCPYAPGATGNLATEDLIYVLDGLGIETGVDLAALVEASAFMEGRIAHALPSRYANAVRTRR